MKKLIFAACALAVTLSSAVFAADFSSADQMYDERQTGFSHYQATVKAYEDIIKAGGLSTDELFYAVSQINRMHLFYGDLVLRSFVKDDFNSSLDMSAWKVSGDLDKARRETFEACIQNNKNISLNNASLASIYATDTGLYKAQYYYWELACTALKAEASNIIDRLALGKKIDSLDDVALSLTNKTYEGGGIMRTLSGVYANFLSVAVNMYKPAESLNILVNSNKILDLTAHPQDKYNRPSRFFFANYRYIARAWSANNNKAEAAAALDEGLSNIEDTLEILSEGDEDNWTPTAGNIFELTLERDRIEFEASKL